MSHQGSEREWHRETVPRAPCFKGSIIEVDITPDVYPKKCDDDYFRYCVAVSSRRHEDILIIYPMQISAIRMHRYLSLFMSTLDHAVQTSKDKKNRVGCIMNVRVGHVLCHRLPLRVGPEA